MEGEVDLDCKLAELDDSSTPHPQSASTEHHAEPIFDLLYEAHGVVAVVKPNRLLVHRTDIDYHEPYNLRDLVNKGRHQADWLHPVHRLDKPTSGIVLFAQPGDALNGLKLEFVHRRTTKVYWAIVRGWTEDEGSVDKPLPTAHNPKPKEAITHYKTLARTELQVPVGSYETSRYSLVECRPMTGRFHQIRLHFKHLRHPILGDTRYGDKQHNRSVAAHTGSGNLMLHAGDLAVALPEKRGMLHATAGVPASWAPLLDGWEWDGNVSDVPREHGAVVR